MDRCDFLLQEGDRVEHQDGGKLVRGTVIGYDWGSSFTSVRLDGDGRCTGTYSYYMRLLSPLETFIEQV